MSTVSEEKKEKKTSDHIENWKILGNHVENITLW